MHSRQTSLKRGSTGRIVEECENRKKAFIDLKYAIPMTSSFPATFFSFYARRRPSTYVRETSIHGAWFKQIRDGQKRRACDTMAVNVYTIGSIIMYFGEELSLISELEVCT